MGKQLASAGINTFLPILPGIYTRVENGFASGVSYLYPYLPRIYKCWEHAIIDIFSIIDFLDQNNLWKQNNCLFGYCLGGMISSIVSVTDPRVYQTVFMTTGGHLPRIIFESTATRFARKIIHSRIKKENFFADKKMLYRIYDEQLASVKKMSLHEILNDEEIHPLFRIDPLSYAHLLNQSRAVFIDALFDHLRSLAFLKLAFPLNDARDLDFIKESFGLSDEQRDHLFKLPQHGVAVVRYGAYPDPFLLSVPNFELDHLVSDAELEELMDGWWAELEKHVKRAETGDESIGSITIEEPSPPMSSEAITLLYTLSASPFTRVSDMTSFPGFSSPQKIGKILSWLKKNGFIERKEYQLSRTGRKAVFAVLTDKARKALNISGKGSAGKGSFEHSLYQDVIAQFYRARGIDAKIEGRVKGKKAIDVLVKDPAEGLVAFEVTKTYDILDQPLILV
jgi:hypothetical protein